MSGPIKPNGFDAALLELKLEYAQKTGGLLRDVDEWFTDLLDKSETVTRKVVQLNPE